MLDRERGLEKDGLAEIQLFDRAHPDTPTGFSSALTSLLDLQT